MVACKDRQFNGLRKYFLSCEFPPLIVPASAGSDRSREGRSATLRRVLRAAAIGRTWRPADLKCSSWSPSTAEDTRPDAIAAGSPASRPPTAAPAVSTPAVGEPAICAGLTLAEPESLKSIIPPNTSRGKTPTQGRERWRAIAKYFPGFRGVLTDRHNPRPGAAMGGWRSHGHFSLGRRVSARP